MATENYSVTSCLFCHEETSFLSNEIIGNQEEEAGVDNFGLNIQSWEVPITVKEKLKPIFIVRKLLDVPEEKCAEYLQHDDNEKCSETHSSWFGVCKSCDSTVEESYRIYRKIKQLEFDLEKLKIKLKQSMLRVTTKENRSRKRRTRSGFELGTARDFIHVDIRKFVAEENAHILADKGLPVATQQTVKRENRKRRNRRKAREVTPTFDFADSDYLLDSPINDTHHTSDVDIEWEPLFWNSKSESDLHTSIKKENGDDYDADSDYSPSLKTGKIKSRSRTAIRTQRHRKKKKLGDEKLSIGESAQEVEKKDRNGWKRVRLVYVQRCKLCPAVFRKITLSQRHEQIHASGAGFPCSHCGWLFHTKQSLHRHLIHKHNEPKSKRHTVRKRKPRKSKYIYEELDAIPYYCDHCHMIYKSKAVLLRHIRNYHNNVAYLTCNFCDSGFPTKQLLELHCKEQHPSSSETSESVNHEQEIKEEPQICEHCSQSYPSTLKRDLHIATDHRDILLMCKICGYKATKYSVFIEHNRNSHNQEKKKPQYMCEHCPKAFSCLTYMFAHMRAIHFDLLGVNPVICKECNVTFHSSGALLEHENHVHKKIKGRCCEYCGKAFSRGCDLKRHILLHTAPREEQYKKGPFFCQFCQAKFNVRQGLYYHLKKKHTDKYEHKCDYCGTGYVTQNTLLQHLRVCKAKKQTPTEELPLPAMQIPPSSSAAIDVGMKQEDTN